MSSKKQIIVLSKVRKHRAEKMALKYSEAVSQVKLANVEVENAIAQKEKIFEKLQYAKTSFSDTLITNVVNSSTLASWRTSIHILKQEMDQAANFERQCRDDVRELEVNAEVVKKEYRKIMIAYEKMKIMQDFI